MKYKDIPKLSIAQTIRFIENISIDISNCWDWIGRKNKHGYGIFKFNQVEYYAHRVSYSSSTNNLSNKLVLDHICRNRSCVNPNHLRQVTPSVNASENTFNPLHLNSLKTHCKHGHEFTNENTLFRPDGRRCRICKRNNEVGRKRCR